MGYLNDKYGTVYCAAYSMNMFFCSCKGCFCEKADSTGLCKEPECIWTENFGNLRVKSDSYNEDNSVFNS